MFVVWYRKEAIIVTNSNIQELLDLGTEMVVYCGCSAKNTTGTVKGGCC